MRTQCEGNCDEWIHNDWTAFPLIMQYFQLTLRQIDFINIHNSAHGEIHIDYDVRALLMASLNKNIQLLHETE